MDCKAFLHGVVVNIEDLPQRGLVSAGQIPGNRDIQRMRGFKNEPVPLPQLFRGQKSAERVIDVGIGSGLIQDHVAFVHFLNPFRNSRQKIFSPRRIIFIFPACGVMFDP